MPLNVADFLPELTWLVRSFSCDSMFSSCQFRNVLWPMVDTLVMTQSRSFCHSVQRYRTACSSSSIICLMGVMVRAEAAYELCIVCMLGSCVSTFPAVSSSNHRLSESNVV